MSLLDPIEDFITAIAVAVLIACIILGWWIG